MPRLRTTTALSVLLLAGGTAGTMWLSSLTGNWSGPPPGHAVSHPLAASRHRAAPSRIRQEEPPRRPRWPALAAESARASGAMQAGTDSAAPPILQPLATPSSSVPYQGLRGHLSGNLVLRLQIDGEGRVLASSVAHSSGDPILDEHALASIRDWRFAVPPEHPQGLSGELPMSFDGEADAQP